MAKKVSLHVGLNTVDGSKYAGNYDPLNNAEYDAEFYKNFAAGKGFAAKSLIGKEATSLAFFSTIKKISGQLGPGDLFFLTFSGHGTRVKDLNADEEEKDGYDEALVLYDRIIIDDELKNVWRNFQEDARIFFLSDSCFNGKVSRMFRLMEERMTTHHLAAQVFRGIDITESEIDFNNNLGFYSSIQLSRVTDEVKSYALIHLASCQNNQLADDGNKANKSSYFTGVFRELFEKDNFQGSYRSLYESLLREMPPWQSPNWDNHNESMPNNFESTSAFE